jgi:uncharacterized cysteine cluster protein YcgN (CxxCxxCC family)
MDTIWINPVVKGFCDSSKCGAGCCQVRVFDSNGNYTVEPCEHLDTVILKCKIYESRFDGCKIYPTVENLQREIYAGCGYYLDNNK